MEVGKMCGRCGDNIDPVIGVGIDSWVCPCAWNYKNQCWINYSKNTRQKVTSTRRKTPPIMTNSYYKQALENLLALVHKDFGEHTTKIGIVKSVEEAHGKYCALLRNQFPDKAIEGRGTETTALNSTNDWSWFIF